jgi:hypothetical protein
MISGNRMWGWLALVAVVAVVALFAVPTLMSAVKTRHENPISADLQTSERTHAKSQNQPGPDQPSAP